jgi:hypothetical protein
MPSITIEELDAFTRAYVECALWLADENPAPGEWARFEEFYPRLSEEALQEMIEDCRQFQADEKNLLEITYQYSGYEVSQAGHDFYLSRNGHGAGYFDRGLSYVGDRLQKAARIWGTSELYEGDDGKLYLTS